METSIASSMRLKGEQNSVSLTVIIPVDARSKFTVHEDCFGMAGLEGTVIPRWRHEPSNISFTTAVILVDIEASTWWRVSKNGKVILFLGIQVVPGRLNQATFGKPVMSVAISSVKHNGNNFHLTVIQGNARLQREIIATFFSMNIPPPSTGFVYGHRTTVCNITLHVI